MIKISNLSMSYSKVIALSNVSLNINDGDIFVVVGPNGSGKTTLLRNIIKDLAPDRGEIYINDKPITEKDKINFAYMSEKRDGIDRFTVSDYRSFYSFLYPKWDDSLFFSLVSSFKIPDTRKFKNMSMGNKTALMFALTVGANTDYLFFDEPTQNLDPQRRYTALEVIKKLSIQGKTVIISSHQMEEMEGVATSFAVILNSVLLYTDDLDNAKDHHRIVSRLTNESAEMIAVLNENEVLVKTQDPDLEFGRYPKFGEIIVGYLKRGIQL